MDHRSRLFLASATFAALALSSARAEPQGFLETIKKHTTLASTITDNGDLNPYAVVVAPV